eukprot:1591942-Rhodomonas_salina.2
MKSFSEPKLRAGPLSAYAPAMLCTVLTVVKRLPRYQAEPVDHARTVPRLECREGAHLPFESPTRSTEKQDRLEVTVTESEVAGSMHLSAFKTPSAFGGLN